VIRLKTETGETGQQKLAQSSDDAERFYRELPGPSLIGMEATGNCHWLVDLLAEIGHEYAAQIRASYVQAAEDGQAGRGAHTEAAGGRTISACRGAVK
jgi:transposase